MDVGRKSPNEVDLGVNLNFDCWYVVEGWLQHSPHLPRKHKLQDIDIMHSTAQNLGIGPRIIADG